MGTQNITLKYLGSCNTPRKPPPESHCVSKVRVVVRVRPFLAHEISAKNGNPRSCISVLDGDFESRDEVTVHLKDPDTSRNECYQLDSFFDQDDNNVRRIFETEVSPLIPGVFRGCNATVFAYGATGSGKTFTMQGTDELPGLMPLAMSTILSIGQRTGTKVEISYYEVYLDRCYDLLELKLKEIAILVDEDGQIHLKGLSQVPVSSMSEFQELFSCGIRRRKIAHTGINDVSSRSHGVLVIAVSTPCGDGSAAFVNGKLNLIDLAGNEDNRRTCNEGMRLIESAKINQSLFALSNVIYALNNNKPRVPYRESKLTRILQDSLGGTSCALMVACLNPGEYQESVHTVSLAARSRHISNFVSSAQRQETPKVKIDMEERLRAWLESKGKTRSLQKPGTISSPCPASSAKKLNYYSSAKAKVDTNRGASAKKRELSIPCRNLFHDRDLIGYYMERLHFAAEDNLQVISAVSTKTTLESAPDFPSEPLDKEEKMAPIDPKDSIGASPTGETRNIPWSPLRKALSPINSNTKPVLHQEAASTNHKCPASFEPKTPMTPFLGSGLNQEVTAIDTPLDKFNAMSTNLKSSIIQEYIGFLNIASREELIGIKGIGMKMAEYIVELREESPLRSLSDLEKIGLSTKQVHNMFNRAARGIFDRQEGTTHIWTTRSEGM